MAEILIKAVSAVHPDPVKDQQGSYKRGMPVVVKPDGHPWGAEEGLPKFVVLKIPGIAVATVQKYIDMWRDLTDPLHPVPVQRRRWRLRWADLPAGVQAKLATGVVTIKAGAYDGPYDYTWAQVKAYFRNDETGLDETADL